jgi:hypothetical protein
MPLLASGASGFAHSHSPPSVVTLLQKAKDFEHNFNQIFRNTL